MDNESSLLAYLVPRLTSRGEDTATDALSFILNKSGACRDALDRLLSEQNVALEPIVRLETQVSSNDGSRPDMVGYGREDHKRLLVESKFWASLQEGQADGYFRQLEASGPAVLMFVAPASRIETLWVEIRRQLEADPKPVRLESAETGDRMCRAVVAGSEKRVLLVSWDLLLGRLEAVVPADSQVVSDIRQLRGFAEAQDLDAFPPLQVDEFAPSLARRILWINRLIDDVIKRGVEDGWMAVDNWRPNLFRAGSGRAFRFIEDSGARKSDYFLLSTFFDLWATKGDTPLWLRTWHKTPATLRFRDGEHRPRVFEDANTIFTPIYLMVGVEYHHVLDDVVDQLRRIAGIVVA